MLYKEGTVPAKEEKRRSHHSEPYYAPTHAGGLFAINREWFKELGWYDPGMLPHRQCKNFPSPISRVFSLRKLVKYGITYLFSCLH